MVNVVLGIIDGYRMGSLRALAQEPVQNAKDAGNQGKSVDVEYRLLSRQARDGSPCHLLTVTDSGTTGLQGPILNEQDLEERNYILRADENWAAFEGQGFTKENEDALGSRGQGKAAFLYHSQLPGEQRRMAMLYDTLLPDDEYRLGARYARPMDRVREPLFGETARLAIQEAQHEVFEDTFVPLGLKPLEQVGSRIIIPFLSQDALKAIQSGDLVRWLQRCWWRAIQKEQLRITVVDEEQGTETEVAVPAWWGNLPRGGGGLRTKGKLEDLGNGVSRYICGEIPLGDGHIIQRLVLMHDQNLSEDEIIHDHPEFAGVQLLRGDQWIETRGVLAEYGDWIPAEQRQGFRGFVEFKRHTDAALREIENSQHDGFNGRHKLFQDVREKLREKVREFSEQMGWDQGIDTSPQEVSQREKRIHAQFLQTFTQPRFSKIPSDDLKQDTGGIKILWDCRLAVDFPYPERARVDWGQHIRHVYLEVSAEPAEEILESATVLLEWVDAQGKREELWRKEVDFLQENSHGRIHRSFEVGDWQLIRGKAKQKRQISCPSAGIHRLRAVVEYQGERVKEISRTVYVQLEPPLPPEEKPFGLSISPVNENAPEQKRIDHGQVLLLQINAKNRSTNAAEIYLDARIDDELLADHLRVELLGTPAGDTPQRVAALTVRRRLLDPEQTPDERQDGIPSMVMEESVHRAVVVAELRDCENDEVMVHSRQTVYFQLDPGKRNSNLPFDIRQKQEGTYAPMWVLNQALDELSYPRNYPLWEALSVVQRQRRALQGRDAFTAEISANGLLEWALRPVMDGDESNFEQLMDVSWEKDGGASDALWESYHVRLDKLLHHCCSENGSPFEYSKDWRETVALMLEIFRQEAG